MNTEIKDVKSLVNQQQRAALGDKSNNNKGKTVCIIALFIFFNLLFTVNCTCIFLFINFLKL